jgi:hypothetical protein
MTSEMPVSIYQITRHNIPEDKHIHTRRCENLKSLTVYESTLHWKVQVWRHRETLMSSTKNQLLLT